MKKIVLALVVLFSPVLPVVSGQSSSAHKTVTNARNADADGNRSGTRRARPDPCGTECRHSGRANGRSTTRLAKLKSTGLKSTKLRAARRWARSGSGRPRCAGTSRAVCPDPCCTGSANACRPACPNSRPARSANADRAACSGSTRPGYADAGSCGCPGPGRAGCADTGGKG